MNENFEVQILVNGNKCKQYTNQNNTYIEAKAGSEYCLEIKNNTSRRILAVTSIDGLNTLNGETASEMDSGYVIGSYSSEKIKGFRISDEEWALFKFGYKFTGKTYAQSKNDGSEKNCGVIGIRIFEEKLSPINYYNNITQTIYPHYPYDNSYIPSYTYGPPIYTYYGGGNIYGTPPTVCCNNNNINELLSSQDPSNNPNININFMSTNVRGKGMSSGGCCSNAFIPFQAQHQNIQTEPSFDIGTEFGKRESSRLSFTNFEKGNLIQKFDIYYASKESLIRMGIIPLINTLSTNSLPQSFPNNNYCKPPKNWVG